MNFLKIFCSTYCIYEIFFYFYTIYTRQKGDEAEMKSVTSEHRGAVDSRIIV